MNNYEKEQIKERITDFAERNLSKAKKPKKSNNIWACPFCESGLGKIGTSTMSIKDKTFNCVKCGESGDIFTLAAKHYNLDKRYDFPEICERVSNDLGIHLSSSIEPTYQAKQPESEVKPLQLKYDYSEYIENCIEKLTKSEKAREYLSETRGFTEDIIKRFRLGYDSDKDAVVIPYNSESTYYISRSIKEEEKKYRKPKSNEAGTEPLFNAEALNSEEFVFVTEGAFDAISFEQLGYRSVALGGVGAGKLIDAISGMKQKPRLILALDNDDSGKDASVDLEKALQEHEVDFMGFCISRRSKRR